MSKEKLRSVDVEIAGRTYPIFVSEEEEKEVLDMVKHLNLEIKEVHSRYANKLSKQDVLAMLLMTYAKKLRDQENAMHNSQVSQKLDDLYLLLEEAQF